MSIRRNAGSRPRHVRSDRQRSRRTKVAAAVIGAVFAGAAAFAATNWAVSLNSNSTGGEAQSANPSTITITASATPAATNLLYPGSNGDVVATITNSNSAPVTITGLTLPAATSYATGYSNASLTTAQTGCSASTSLVAYAYAATGGSHTLTTPLTVAANGTLTVTFTNDAVMGAASPAACENTYFQLPSFTAVAATLGAGTATTSPVTDAWTS